MKRDGILTILILLGLLAGAVVGEIIHVNADNPTQAAQGWMDFGKLILVRPLMLMVLPLVFLSVIVGTTSIGDPSRLGVIGGSTLLYYFATMLMAVILGAVLVTTIAPGEGLPPELVASLQADGVAAHAEATNLTTAMDTASEKGLSGAWMNILEQVIPSNVFAEFANGRTLGVIVFSLLLGLALAACGKKAKPAINFFHALFSGIMQLVLWILWLTPLGVFLLVTGTVARIGLGSITGPLGSYMMTVFIGLAIHAFVVLPLIMFIFNRSNPFRFMWQMRKALLTAFGTDSSSATLPVTIETAIDEGNVSRKSANFVLPLGATINMDGTALYEAVAVVFMFQLWGIPLEFSDLVIVVITATLAAVGAAGIPSAGLVTMVIVVAAVNTSLAARGHQLLPLEAIGVIIGVDRILDMCRTTVNVWGDAVGAKIISRLAPDEEKLSSTD